MMAIDFTSPHLQPRISSDKCCSENHEVENLTSGDLSCRSRGFLCEHFIRPPVYVTIAFPCQIELQSVIVDPWIGGQKSCGFELYSCSENVSSWLMKKKEGMQSCSMDKIKMEKIAGRYDKNESSHPLFVFTNKYFQAKAPFNLPSTAAKKTWTNTSREICGDIRHKEKLYTMNVSHLIIKITGTLNATVPCIKQLSIYGQPSFSCSKQVKSEITCIVNALLQGPLKHVVKTVEVPESHPQKLHDFGAPEEFLDELTYDLMVLPILLPSGHNIDQSTLDRFSMEEAIWGRSPSDPFTGLQFGTKAVVNYALKARIDQYVTQARISNIGRTTGKQPVHQMKTEQIARHDTEPIVGKRKSNDNCERPSKVQRLSQCLDHEQNLRDSLEDALGTMLRSLPSFTNSPAADSTIQQCSQCSLTLQAHWAYSLPCSHLICGVCVRNHSLCAVCKSKSSSKDVFRIHL